MFITKFHINLIVSSSSSTLPTPHYLDTTGLLASFCLFTFLLFTPFVITNTKRSLMSLNSFSLSLPILRKLSSLSVLHKNAPEWKWSLRWWYLCYLDALVFLSKCNIHSSRHSHLLFYIDNLEKCLFLPVILPLHSCRSIKVILEDVSFILCPVPGRGIIMWWECMCALLLCIFFLALPFPRV